VHRVVNLAGRFDVREGVERRLGHRVLQQLQEEGRVRRAGEGDLQCHWPTQGRRGAVRSSLSQKPSKAHVNATAVPVPCAPRPFALAAGCKTAAAAVLQVEMRGRSRARGEFTWLLTRADLEDRLATDVAAACSAVPPGVRVLTVHGTGAAGSHAAPAARAGRLPSGPGAEP
jgi:hypothetical protein